MGKFQLNKKGEDPLKIYEDVFKIANDTVETHLDKLGKMPKPISESKASGTCPNCGSDKTGSVADKWGYISGWQDNYCDNCGKHFNADGTPMGESKASEDATGSDKDLGDVINQVPFDEQQGRFRTARDEESPLDNIYSDDKTAQRIADGTQSTYASDIWESVEAIASEYTSHKYDKEIQQTLDNIAKKQAEYTRECPDGCGKKFNTIDDNAVAYHLYHDHGYSSEDSRKSAGLESKASEVFSPSDEEVLEYIRNNPSQNGTEIITGMGWDGVEETDIGIMRLKRAGKIWVSGGGYVTESKASEKEDPMHYKRSGGWNILDEDQNNTSSWYAKGDLVNARKEADRIDGHVADDETGSLVYTSWLKNDLPSWFVIESRVSE